MNLTALQGKSAYVLSTSTYHVLFSHGELIAVRRGTLAYVANVQRRASQKHLTLFLKGATKILPRPAEWFDGITIELVKKH